MSDKTQPRFEEEGGPDTEYILYVGIIFRNSVIRRFKTVETVETTWFQPGSDCADKAAITPSSS